MIIWGSGLQFPELGRCFANKFSKLLVKMAQIVKTTIVGDINNIQVRI